MRRSLLVLASVFTAALVALPAAADVSGQVVYEQRMNIHVDMWMGDGSYLLASLTFVATRGLDAGVPGPVESVQASGYLSAYDTDTGAENLNFDSQEVGAAAYVSDPIGNHATLQMTLVSTQNTSHEVDLVVSRPAWFTLDTPSPMNPGVNAWYDPATSDASVWTNSGAMVNRDSYTVEGTVAGHDLSSAAGVFTNQGLRLNSQVTLP